MRSAASSRNKIDFLMRDDDLILEWHKILPRNLKKTICAAYYKKELQKFKT